MASASRFEIWDKLEDHAAAIIEAMDVAARSKNWTDKDIEDWDDIYHALIGRPRMTPDQTRQLRARGLRLEY